MKRQVAYLVFLVSACGTGTDFSAELRDHTNALTVEGDDLLFELTILESEKAYEFSDLRLLLQQSDETQISLQLELELDVNEDGMLGTGDTLVGQELTPAFGTGVLGPDVSGNSFGIELTVRTGLPPEVGPIPTETLWTGTWLAE